MSDREIDARENHQPGEREHKMEWQRHHTGQVVQIENTALIAFVRPEGEQLAEQLAVHDHAGDQRHQHDQRRQPDNPVAQILPMQIEAVVQRIEEAAADLQLIVRQGLAGARIDGAGAPHQLVRVVGVGHLVAGEQSQHRVPVRGVGAPAHRRVEMFRHRPIHPGAHLVDAFPGGLHVLEYRLEDLVEGRHRLRLEAALGNRPAVDFPIEHRQRTEEEHHHQHETQEQPKPGVNPGHGETEILKHGDSPSAHTSAC